MGGVLYSTASGYLKDWIDDSLGAPEPLGHNHHIARLVGEACKHCVRGVADERSRRNPAACKERFRIRKAAARLAKVWPEVDPYAWKEACDDARVTDWIANAKLNDEDMPSPLSPDEWKEALKTADPALHTQMDLLDELSLALHQRFLRYLRDVILTSQTSNGAGFAAIQFRTYAIIISNQSAIQASLSSTDNEWRAQLAAIREGIDSLKPRAGISADHDKLAGEADRLLGALASEIAALKDHVDASADRVIKNVDDSIGKAVASLTEQMHDRAPPSASEVSPPVKSVRDNFLAAGVSRNTSFVGRVRLLKELHDHYFGSGSRTPPPALTADGGIGKTELAMQYVTDPDRSQHWAGIWWLNVETDETLRQSLFQTLTRLGLNPADEAGIVLLWQALCDHVTGERHLIVLDNVSGWLIDPADPPRDGEPPVTLHDLQVEGETRLLLTTRRTDIPPTLVTRIDVGLLDDDDCKRLLVLHRPDLRDEASGMPRGEFDTAVGAVATQLDHHALAVALAAAALRKQRLLTPQDLLARLTSADVGTEDHVFKALDASDTGRRYRLKVAASLLLHVEDLADECPLALDVLRLASLCMPKSIPVDLITSALGAAEAEDQDAVRDAIDRLADRSMIRVNASAITDATSIADRVVPTISLHLLTQSAVRGRESNAALNDSSDALLAALTEWLRQWDVPDAWPMLRACAPHAEAWLNRTANGGDAPERARLLDVLAGYLDEAGRQREAEPIYQQALDMRRRLFDGDHPHVANSLNNLAFVRNALGRAAEAEPIYQEALDMTRRLFEGDHPDVANSLNNLGGVKRALGQADEAEPIFQEALDMTRRLFEGDHRNVALSLNNLAGVKHALGRADLAEPIFQEVLDMTRRLFEGDHPDVANSLNNLGGVKRALGQADEAEPIFQEALDMRRRLFKGDHPDVAISLNNLGGVKHALGRAGEAEPIYQEALDMHRRLFDGDHPDVALGLNNLAFVKEALGRDDEAEPIYQEALDMRRRLFKGDHPDVAISLNNLAGVKHALGRAGEAEPIYQEALDMRRRLFKGDHPDVALSLNNLASVRFVLRRKREAIEPLTEAVEMAQRCLPEGHPDREHYEKQLAALTQLLASDDGRP